MAKKPDPSAPKGRVKPGTPSKLLKGKVFGYHGKYVWKTTFDAQTKAREAAKKGSALVKRTSSAITNTTKAALAKAPKGEIVKIKPTDSPIVKAAKRAYNAGKRTRSIINKIYEAGKTTRKNVDTVYKAGKEARKVHDKVVKGGKEVVKGAYEGGKDTKRAVNRLKPGGKITVSKGGKITRYKKKPTSIVKTKGSKITPYKNPRTGKLATRGKVTPTTPKKTPVSQRRVNAKLKLERQKKGTTKDTAFNRKYKVRGSSTNPWKTNKKGVITNTSSSSGYDSKKTKVKPRVLLNKAKNIGKKGWQKGVKFAKSPRGVGIAKGIGKVGGAVEKVTLPWALKRELGHHINSLKNLGVVPGSGNFGKRLTFDQKNVRNTGESGYWHNKIYEAKKKRLAKESAKTKYDKSKKGDQPTKTEKPTTRVHNPNKLVGGGNAGRSTDSGGTSGNNQKLTIKKTVQKNQTNKTDTPYGQSPKQKQVSPKKVATKKKRMHSIEKKNREIHGDKAVDRLKKKHAEWKIARKNGTLAAWRKKWKKK